MDNQMNAVYQGVRRWLNEHYLLLVIVLAISEIGLAYNHPRNSGIADTGSMKQPG
jgi:hypothetical protein